ncbi:MAG: SPOR domain-containing protein [Treponemataceae bacterium]
MCKTKTFKIFIIACIFCIQKIYFFAQFTPVSVEKNSELYTQINELRGKLDSQNAEKNQEIWSQLSSIYEQIGEYFDAASAYSQAALLSPPNLSPKYTLGQARCLLFAGDVGSAQEVLNDLLQTGADILDKKTFAEVKLLNIWCDIAKAPNSNAQAKNIALLRSYIADDNMENVRSACLYTLWWLSGDDQVKNTLQRDYPASPEAALVGKEATLMPSAIWFLTERKSNESDMKSNPPVATAPATKPAASKGSSETSPVFHNTDPNTQPLAQNNIPLHSAIPVEIAPPVKEKEEQPKSLEEQDPIIEKAASPVATDITELERPNHEQMPQSISETPAKETPNSISAAQPKPPQREFLPSEVTEVTKDSVPQPTAQPTPKPTPRPRKSNSPPRKWQQVGLFREESNAQKLVAKLAEQGFKAEILYRERETGIFYIVAVKDTNNTMKFKLQKAGYESYSIME